MYNNCPYLCVTDRESPFKRGFPCFPKFTSVSSGGLPIKTNVFINILLSAIYCIYPVKYPTFVLDSEFLKLFT